MSSVTDGEVFRNVKLSCSEEKEKDQSGRKEEGERLFSLSKGGAGRDEAAIWRGSGDRLRLCRRPWTDIEH